jgi:ABC-type transporter Mla MlaB component
MDVASQRSSHTESFLPDDARHVVAFAGRCSILSVETHHRRLIDASCRNQAIIVDLSEVEQVDVSFIQLLISAKNGAVAQKKPFSVENIPDGIAAMVQKAGLTVEQLSHLPSLS